MGACARHSHTPRPASAAPAGPPRLLGSKQPKGPNTGGQHVPAQRPRVGTAACPLAQGLQGPTRACKRASPLGRSIGGLACQLAPHQGRLRAPAARRPRRDTTRANVCARAAHAGRRPPAAAPLTLRAPPPRRLQSCRCCAGGRWGPAACRASPPARRRPASRRARRPRTPRRAAAAYAAGWAPARPLRGRLQRQRLRRRRCGPVKGGISVEGRRAQLAPWQVLPQTDPHTDTRTRTHVH